MRRFLLLSVSTFLLISSGNGGVPNYLCGSRPASNSSENPSVGSTRCAIDCKQNHGSLNPQCGFERGEPNNYNCYCDKHDPRNGDPKNSVQCAKRVDDYRNICTLDCLCVHGAYGGRCNYEANTCECFGHNPNNFGCPVRTAKEFFELIAARFSTEILPRHVAFSKFILEQLEKGNI